MKKRALYLNVKLESFVYPEPEELLNKHSEICLDACIKEIIY